MGKKIPLNVTFQWITWINFKVSIGTVSETCTQRFQDRLKCLKTTWFSVSLGHVFVWWFFFFCFILLLLLSLLLFVRSDDPVPWSSPMILSDDPILVLSMLCAIWGEYAVYRAGEGREIGQARLFLTSRNGSNCWHPTNFLGCHFCPR